MEKTKWILAFVAIALIISSPCYAEWAITYGGSNYDAGRSIQQTTDGGYIVAGYTWSFGAGNYDFWVLKLNSNGSIAWQKTYGGSDGDCAYSIQQTFDQQGNPDGYIVAGETVSFGAGSGNFWVLRLDDNGEIPNCSIMGTSEAIVLDNISVSGKNTSAVVQDSSVTPLNTTISPQNTSAETSDACLAFMVEQEIMYDGYLDKTQDGILADTLITVTHGNKNPVLVKIEVYDKYGDKAAEEPLLNGGETLENNNIPVKGFGWITLGMIVSRVTNNPLGSPGGEKFTFKVSTGKSGDAILKATIVEVKQVTYNTRQENPGEAVWDPTLIKTWSETTLGGRRGPGLVKYPSKWDQ